MKVRCIDALGVESHLTKGKVYEVTESTLDQDYFVVTDDTMYANGYFKNRFEVIPSIDDVIKDKEREKSEMSNPSLGQIVNLCKKQDMRVMYVVESNESRLVNTDKVLNQYPDVEIDALTVEMFSTVDYKRSTVLHQIFRVFI